MKRPITVTIDDELFNKITEDKSIKLSHRVEDLISKGLIYEEQTNPKYVVDNTFNYLKELIKMRDNKEIKITLLHTVDKG